MAGRPVHTFEVLRTEQLTPHIVRVVLGGGGFDTFKPERVHRRLRQDRVRRITASMSRACRSR